MTMLAAAKVDTLEYIEFDGIHDEYPSWFLALIKEEMVFKEYGTTIYSSEHGPHILFEGDVFLLNKFGNVMFMNREDFTDMYYDVN